MSYIPENQDIDTHIIEACDKLKTLKRAMEARLEDMQRWQEAHLLILRKRIREIDDLTFELRKLHHG